jgi:hypothetical protein
MLGYLGCIGECNVIGEDCLEKQGTQEERGGLWMRDSKRRSRKGLKMKTVHGQLRL